MGDVFKEQIVKKSATTTDVFKKAGLVVAAFILIAVLFFVSSLSSLLGMLMPFIFVGVLFGVYYIFSFFDVEYEYVLTNGELDIDVIYKRSRRRRVFSGSVNSFEIMAHIDDKMHVREFDSAELVRNYSSGVTKENTYAFLTSYKGKKLKVIFEPNSVILDAVSRYLTPRKLFKK